MGSGRRTRRNQNEWLMPKSMPVVPPDGRAGSVPRPDPRGTGRAFGQAQSKWMTGLMMPSALVVIMSRAFSISENLK